MADGIPWYSIKLNCPEMLRKALLRLSQLHFHRNDLLHLLEDLLSWNPFSPLSIWSSILRWIETANSKMSPWPTNQSISRVLPQDMFGLLAAFKRPVQTCSLSESNQLFPNWLAAVHRLCHNLVPCFDELLLSGNHTFAWNDTSVSKWHPGEPCLSSPPNLHH